MNRVLSGSWVALALVGWSGHASAFDVVDEQRGYISSRYLTLSTGLGFTGFSRQRGIDGDFGFGFRIAGGHHFNRFLACEITYQFSTFRWKSPDPFSPSAALLETRAAMNQEAIRLLLTYPAVMLQPFVSAGFGGYNISSVDRETGLSFPIHVQFPVGAGFLAYLYRDVLSLDVEFNYQFLLGVNQSPDILQVLGLPELRFHTYSLTASFTWHLF